MEINGLVGKFYRISEIAMKIALLQFIWIAFTLCGFIILGIMPATIGLFAVMRRWMRGEEGNRRLIKAYWETFRKEFWKSNLIGVILSVIAYLIYLNVSIIKFTNGVTHFFLLVGVFILSILFLILLIYIFPVYVHYELKFTHYFSMAILLGISFPLHTIFIVVGYFLFYRLLLWIPGLIPFFSVSTLSVFTMWVALRLFNRVERKKENVQKKSKKENTKNVFTYFSKN